MAKQKCGTCRFFQEAGLAGSGWCHHPQRKVSSDVMIMVRRNELACRDEWSRSLWAPAEASSGNPELAFQRSPSQGPVPPAGDDELRALAQISGRELPHAAGEDVLLSEARIIAEPHERASFVTSSQGFDVRSAVFRAREAYKERNRARDVAARKSEGATPLPVAVDEPDAEVLDSFSGESPVSALRWPGISGALPAYQEGPLLEAELADSGSERTVRPPGQQDVSNATVEGVGGPVTAIETYVQHDDSLAWFLETTPPDAVDEYDDPRAPQIQLSTLHRFSSEPLPAWFRTDLPQMCRTCRDFRPTADGRRGWCANAWAFTHPRLVNEDDVSPCDSAFGNWWAAVDDVWLVAADVSNHSRPTPMLDRMVALNSPTKKRTHGTS